MNSAPRHPEVDVDVEAIDNPRPVEWGHLTQVRGRVDGDRVHVVRQKRKHTFGQGVTDSGRELPLYSGSLKDAVAVYRALDALFSEYATKIRGSDDV